MLSNLVFTPGGQPNYMDAGFRAASLIPDLAAKFNEGYNAATQRQMALLDYNQKLKQAQLFNTLYPDLVKYQQAELAAKLAALNGTAPNYLGNPNSVGAGPTPPGRPSGTPTGTPAGTPATAPAQVSPDLSQAGPVAPFGATPFTLSYGQGGGYDPTGGLYPPGSTF